MAPLKKRCSITYAAARMLPLIFAMFITGYFSATHLVSSLTRDGELAGWPGRATIHLLICH